MRKHKIIICTSTGIIELITSCQIPERILSCWPSWSDALTVTFEAKEKATHFDSLSKVLVEEIHLNQLEIKV